MIGPLPMPKRRPEAGNYQPSLIGPSRKKMLLSHDDHNEGGKIAMTDNQEESTALTTDGGNNVLKWLGESLPLPVRVVENLTKALLTGVGSISKPFLNRLTAASEAAAHRRHAAAYIETQVKLHTAYVDQVVKLPDSGLPQHMQELAERAARRDFLETTFRQDCRESIASYMFQHVRILPAPGDEAVSMNAEVDDDWLASFWRCAEEKKAEWFREMFGRILAGECLQPGAFSARLLHIISVMTTEDAKTFQRICSMCIEDEAGLYIVEPVAEFENILDEFIQHDEKLSDYALEELDGIGLLGRSTILAFDGEDDGSEKGFGAKRCRIRVVNHDKLEANQHLTAIPFTRAGEELRSILVVEPNHVYFEAMKSFLSEHLGIEVDVLDA